MGAFYDALVAGKAATAMPKPTATPMPTGSGAVMDLMRARRQAPPDLDLRGYSEIPEEERRFLPEDAGAFDILEVLGRGSQATARFMLDAAEGRDPWDGAVAELMTPGGIKGWKDYYTRTGNWEDTPGEIDAVDLIGFASDVIADPLNLLFAPVKGASLAGRAGKMGRTVGRAFIDASPKLQRVERGLTYLANEAANPIMHKFDLDWGMRRAVREGYLDMEVPEAVQEWTMLYHGKGGRGSVQDALRGAMETISGGGPAEWKTLDDLERDTVSHILSGSFGKSGEVLLRPFIGAETTIGGKTFKITENAAGAATRVRETTDQMHRNLVEAGFDVPKFDDWIRQLYPDSASDGLWARTKAFMNGDVPYKGTGAEFAGATTRGSLKGKTIRGGNDFNLVELPDGSTIEVAEGTLGEAKRLGYAPEEDVAKWLTRYIMEYNRLMSTAKLKERMLTLGRKVTAEDFNAMKGLEDFYKGLGTPMKDFSKITAGLRVRPGPGESIYFPSKMFQTTIPQKMAGQWAGKATREEGLVMEKITDGDAMQVVMNGGEAYILPDAIVDVLNRSFRVFSDAGKAEMGRGWQKLMGMWKSHALLSPGFHVRNLYGGMFNNYIKGMDFGHKSTLTAYKYATKAVSALADTHGMGRLNPERARKILDEPIKGLNVRLRDLVDEAENFGVLGRGRMIAELPGTTGAKMANVLNVFSPENPLLRASRATGDKVEDFLRLSLYINRRLKGDKPFHAAKEVMDGHFDYIYGLTDFERKVRDYAFPFYTFVRKNTALQVKMLTKVPYKYARIPKAVNAFEAEETRDELEWKPDFYEKLGLFKTPFGMEGEGGKVQSLYLFPDFPLKDLTTATNLASPITGGKEGSKFLERFAGLIHQLGQSLGPIPKAVIERSTGFNFFQARQIQPHEQEPVPVTLNWLPDKFKESMGMTEKDGAWMWDRRDQEFYQTLLPLFARINRMFPGQLQQSPKHASALMTTMTGIKFYALDTEKWEKIAKIQASQEARAEHQRQKAISRTAEKINQGQVSSFQPVYQPMTDQQRYSYNRILTAQQKGR